MPIAHFDTEAYPNYWLLKVQVEGCETYSFSLSSGDRFPSPVASRIAQILGSHQLISFNGRNYDVPIIACALSGYSCERLFSVSSQIISGVKHWDLGLPRWEPCDHIDIMETLPGQGSQKMYAGRIHCKTMRDLPYDPTKPLTLDQTFQVADYCDNDLAVLGELHRAVLPQISIREDMGARYGIDLRSKSDAQCAEAILVNRCERVLGRRIYKPEIDYSLTFRYEAPEFLAFSTPQMQAAFATVKDAVFDLHSGKVTMPPELEGLKVTIGSTEYRMGIGGLHSSEKTRAIHSTDTHVLRDADVASFYPSLMINSGKYPLALGPAFIQEFAGLKAERLVDKDEQKRLEKAGLKDTPEWKAAYSANEGKKVFVNGTFGKTLSIYSKLFAPQMGIQTTVTGQLSLLMLVEWLEHYGIHVVSANTDGVVMHCPRHLVGTADELLKEWERRTSLKFDWPLGEYAAIYSRDVNSYIAIKSDGEIKRKGAYSQASLVAKTSPDVEICSDAVCQYLLDGTPIIYTIAACRDIRKFVTVQKVAGGGVKLWGHGPRKDAKVADMVPDLERAGWVKEGRRWRKGEALELSGDAYKRCFAPQTPEYLGKHIRFYYGTESPGPIISNTSGDTVSLSYGAQPCMVLPDELPGDIDYAWYLATAEGMLKEVGYSQS